MKKCYPDIHVKDAYSVDYRGMYEAGYRGIIYDIDNTLVLHGAPADDRARALMQELHEIGYRTMILSNSTGRRAGTFAAAVGSEVETGGRKPLPGKFYVCMQRMETVPETTMCIGDQVFTDILGANLAGVTSVLTDPLSSKELKWVQLKRPFERKYRDGVRLRGR